MNKVGGEMSEVKWIKITTDVFDDEKILMIESLPSSDTIIVVWFKLLALAGKQNNDGVFLMSNRVAYTDEMLASIFRRDINVVRLALTTFEKFGMIEIVDGVVTIPNWNKHQTLDSYEKKKERDRLYQAERREKQRLLIEKSSDNRLTSDDSSSCVAISEEDKEKEYIYIVENDNEIDRKSELEELKKNFNTIYESYPKKVGKAKGYELYKAWLKGRNISGEKIKLTNRQIWLAIAKYKQQIEENGTEKQFIKNFDTFMNKAILDYLEE